MNTRKFWCILFAFVFVSSLFCETEEELKKRILSGANLNGVSQEELMADDIKEEDEGFFSRFFKPKEKKRLPSEFPREVLFTDEMIAFKNAYYNHKITSEELREELYRSAVKSAEKSENEYEKLVRLARADYFMGVSIIEDFDLTSLDSVDLSDGSSAETLSERAGNYFDKAIDYAEAALEIKKGTDAYTILAHSISANCTAKNTAYILGNGLKVRSYARKAVKLDYSNGTAHFLVSAQDLYAPWPFSKVRSGRKQLLSVLSDRYIRLEDHDKHLIYAAIGHSYFRQKKWAKSAEWFKKCQEIYPDNTIARYMLEKIEVKQQKKK